ncbi:MAG: hypothetical protein MZV65_38335 [Chromatiales bacterium]|nr:hypothetical protein [Chromatiales bacterium]
MSRLILLIKIKSDCSSRDSKRNGIDRKKSGEIKKLALTKTDRGDAIEIWTKAGLRAGTTDAGRIP